MPVMMSLAIPPHLPTRARQDQRSRRAAAYACSKRPIRLEASALPRAVTEIAGRKARCVSPWSSNSPGSWNRSRPCRRRERRWETKSKRRGACLPARAAAVGSSKRTTGSSSNDVALLRRLRTSLSARVAAFACSGSTTIREEGSAGTACGQRRAATEYSKFGPCMRSAECGRRPAERAIELQHSV